MKKAKMRGILFFTASFVALAAWADRVELKSGSFLTGQLKGVAAGELTFVSDDLGEIKIPVGKIEKLEDAGEHVIRFADATEATKRLSVAKGVYVADGAPLDMGTVKAIDPVAETWHGKINVAYNAARGNAYENSATVLANVNRRWEKDRVSADFGYYYGETGKADGPTQKTTDKWEVEAQHDHFWWPKVYHYENARWDRDMIQLLRARYRLGLGAGYQWLDGTLFESTGKWNFNQEIGVNWVKEEYENNPDSRDGGFCALRYAHHFGYLPKWVDGLEIFHNAEILPEADEWSKYLAKADVGLSTKLVYDFTLLLKVEWEFNSKPAQDRKQSDVRYIVGLGYAW